MFEYRLTCANLTDGTRLQTAWKGDRTEIAAARRGHRRPDSRCSATKNCTQIDHHELLSGRRQRVTPARIGLTVTSAAHSLRLRQWRSWPARRQRHRPIANSPGDPSTRICAAHRHRLNPADGSMARRRHLFVSLAPPGPKPVLPAPADFESPLNMPPALLMMVCVVTGCGFLNAAGALISSTTRPGAPGSFAGAQVRCLIRGDRLFARR